MSKDSKKKSNSRIIVAAVSVLILVVIVLTTRNGNQSTTGDAKLNRFPVVKDSDIVINLSDVTETVSFYPAEMNGTGLEVLAVKAPDGTVRTAFNTCQVCYGSGRGYYVQEGDTLICQNCGNRFAMDDVEVTRGGCNPVPITSDYKTVDEDTITISKAFLTEATVIFQNWKNELVN